MSPSRHIREHVVGYVAIFLALTGTAAASLPGTNSVDSGDIIDANVQAPDLAAGAIGSTRLIDGSVTGGELIDGSAGPAHLRAGLVNSPKIANASLEAVDFDPFEVQRRVVQGCFDGVARSVGSAGALTCTNPMLGFDLTTPFPGSAGTTIPDWSVTLGCFSGFGGVTFTSRVDFASANWLYTNGSSLTGDGERGLSPGESVDIEFGNGRRIGQIILSNPLRTTTLRFEARFNDAIDHCTMSAGGVNANT